LENFFIPQELKFFEIFSLSFFRFSLLSRYEHYNVCKWKIKTKLCN